MRLILTCAFSILVATQATAQESMALSGPNDDKVPAVMARAVDDFIKPGYRRFVTEARELETSVGDLCKEPSDENLTVARTAFDDTVDAWSRIEILRIGPVIEDNRFERILFYPDRKSTGLKQVQAVLAKPDDSVTSVETLKGKSVAMQGLGAAEYVLFGTGSETLLSDSGQFRCRYAEAIAGNLARVGDELVDAWDDPEGIQAAWKMPGADNPVFRDNQEAAKALLGVLVHAAETVRDQRIEGFYKGPDKRALPKQAIYWRSGNSLRSVTANVEGIRALLEQSGLVELLPEDSRSVVSSIDFVTNAIIRVSNQTTADVSRAVEDPVEMARLDFLLFNTRDLILRLNNDLGGAMGLSAGFSFSDGD